MIKAGLLSAALVALLVVVPNASAQSRFRTERLTLDSYSARNQQSSVVSTRRALTRGQRFIATVQGTFSYYSASDYTGTRNCGPIEPNARFRSRAANGPVGIDPEFIFGLPRGAELPGGAEVPEGTPEAPAGRCPALPFRFSNFQISTGGRFAHPVTVGGPPAAPSATHRYSYELVGRGRRARFRLVDGYLKDNYGRLRITVRRATGAPIPPAPVPTPVPTPVPPPPPPPAPVP